MIGEELTVEQSPGSTFQAKIPDGQFKDGDQIAFRVRGYDHRDYGTWGRWCDITVDNTKPSYAPIVTSTDYPEQGKHGAPGVPGLFKFARDPGDTDVVGFKYSLVNEPPDRFVAAPNGIVELSLTPEDASEFLYVQSVDKAGNIGPIRRYGFLLGDPPPPAGLWRLDGQKPSTAAPDTSGGGRHGTLVGGAWTTGRHGDAVRLDGVDDHVATSGTAPVRTNESFTVSAWARIDDDRTGFRTAVSANGNRMSAFYLQWNRDRGWGFVMPNNDIDSSDGGRVTAPGKVGRWTHLAGVYDAGAREMRLYVDGRLAGRTAHTSTWSGQGSLLIGRAKWNGGFVDYFPGSIDDVRVEQRAVPEGEIRELATHPAILEGRWMLDEDGGTTAADTSGNFRHATAAPGTSWVPGPLPIGSAARFDGVTGEFGTAGEVLRTDQSFTVSAWVNLERFDKGIMRTAVSQDGTEKSAFLLGYRDDTGRWSMLMPGLEVGSTNALVGSSVTPATGEWTHLAGVYDLAKGELRIYVNGAATAAPLPPGWSPWQATGSLRIGRAKWSGRATDQWPGAIDDVNVYTGVRTEEEIRMEAEYWNPHPAPSTVYTGAFARYSNHDGEHLTAAGPVPRGYHPESVLGMAAPPDAAGTATLYTCRSGSDTFTSPRADCEGQQRLGEVGKVYVTPPDGVPVRQLFRCKTTAGGEHFDAVTADCEGQTPDGSLGYLRAYAPLVSFAQADAPRDRRTSVGPVPITYEPRERLGLISIVDDPGMQPIYGCQQGTDAYTSVDAACDGTQQLGRIGFVWTDPPPDLDAVPLSRCRDTETGERYDAEDCGPDQTDAFLGYAERAR